MQNKLLAGSRLLFFILAIAIIRDTAHNGKDFEVFWRAGNYLLLGEPLYSLTRDGAMTFKYPPWIASFFIPFALFSLKTAKILWGLLQVLCFEALFRWARKKQIPALASYFTFFVFFGIWITHALDGQISLPIVTIAVLSYEKTGLKKYFPLIYFLPTKILTAVALFGLPLKDIIREKKAVLMSIFICCALSLPALVGVDDSPSKLLSNWKKSAESGAHFFSLHKTRGRDNQGLPAFFARKLDPEKQHPEYELQIFGVLLFIFVLIFFFTRNWMPKDHFFYLWLALTPVLHPLSWFHSWTWVFPFALVGLWSLIQKAKPNEASFFVFGMLMTTAFTRQTLGAWGVQMELESVKSWGVLVMVFSYLKVQKEMRTQ